MSSPVILSCVNLKGGVGKTAIAVNFAAYCGREKGMKTLLIDLDPQTNASFAMMGVDSWHDHATKKGTIADLFGLRRHTSADGKQKGFTEVVAKEVFPNVDLIPSHLDLFSIDLDMGGASARERKLKNALKSSVEEYDLVVCDCPPNLTIPTQNALTLSTHFIVPVSPDFLSGVGVGLLLSRIDQFCTDIDHTLDLTGIVISRLGRPARHRTETVGALRKQFQSKVMTTEIKELVAVSEATEAHMPVFDKGGEADTLFRKFSEEVLTRLGIA